MFNVLSIKNQISTLALQMHCGFNSVGLIIIREIPCIQADAGEIMSRIKFLMQPTLHFRNFANLFKKLQFDPFFDKRHKFITNCAKRTRIRVFK
jgi:hypothetical protein